MVSIFSDPHLWTQSPTLEVTKKSCFANKQMGYNKDVDRTFGIRFSSLSLPLYGMSARTYSDKVVGEGYSWRYTYSNTIREISTTPPFPSHRCASVRSPKMMALRAPPNGHHLRPRVFASTSPPEPPDCVTPPTCLPHPIFCNDSNRTLPSCPPTTLTPRHLTECIRPARIHW